MVAMYAKRARRGAGNVGFQSFVHSSLNHTREIGLLKSELKNYFSQGYSLQKEQKNFIN
jgi:hypothetical protein